MNEWIVQIDQQVQQQRTTKAQPRPLIATNRRSFYRVPQLVHEEQHPSPYVPQKISIGPYHHQKGEDDKEKCLINFLSRSRALSLKDYTDYLAQFVDEVRDMYDGLDDRWLGEDNKEAFLRMMVVDACYLLEIMMEAMEARLYDKPRPNAVFNSNEMKTYIHDMLLLDNQIPRHLLLHILRHRFSGDMVYRQNLGLPSTRMEASDILQYLTQGFFSLPGPPPHKYFSDTSLHLLNKYRMILLGGPESSAVALSPFPYHMFPSATELEEAQIVIRPSMDRHQTNISFEKRTGLVLQQIVLDGATSLHFRQVILHESFDPTVTMHFSSYIYFMHCLLKEATDSRLLRKCGILRTTLLDEEVIEMFNGLSKNISFHHKGMESGISLLMRSVREQFNENMQAWRKDLFQKYLRSPWALVSILFAFLIFTFTALQTLYTILRYYKGKK